MKTKQKYWLDPSPECRNCGYLMPEQANYCPSCSQRNTTGKINVFQFLKEALSNLLNIDTKLFRTLFSIIFPGKLTNEFFRGRHQSFASPIRMFFVIMLFFIAALSWRGQEYITDSDFMGIEEAKTQMAFQDSISVIKLQMETENLSELERAGVDTFYNKLIKKISTDLDLDEDEEINIQFNFSKELTFKRDDLLKLTPDELLEKYKVENLFIKSALKQLIKLNKNPDALAASIFGNLTLMFLMLIPCVAFVFKLLYVRTERFYVEHLVFLFHYHSLVLFIGIIMLLTMEYNTILINFSVVLFLMGYLLIAMKKVYGQGWMKTILKSFFIFICYLIIFTFCFLFISTISFLLF